MRKLIVFLLPVFILSCKKDTPAGIRGVWVEKTLRVDTMTFDNSSLSADPSTFYLRSRPYWDLALNPDYPINHSAIYRYKIDGDTMRLNSFYSSYSGLYPYSFKTYNSTSFTIGKFYNRSGLPALLEFERIE
jgi:hypothetical protein